MSKPTLGEMADAVQFEADRIRGSHARRAELRPAERPDMDVVRHIAILDAAANLMRIMGTFEDKSRKFVAGLLKEHAG